MIKLLEVDRDFARLEILTTSVLFKGGLDDRSTLLLPPLFFSICNSN
jgi:hypothetical protein